MTIEAFVRVIGLAATLTFAGAALVPSLSASAAEHGAPAVPADGGSAFWKRIDVQLARLQHRLHITATQMTPWNALTEAMRDNAKRIQLSRADRAKIHPTNVIDELYADRRETQARLERLERIIPKAEALYAVLTADQKKKAEAIFGGLRRDHEAILDTDD
jgi:hypothetical protein